MPKTVLAFGTFDILHPGHISYLQQAKVLGERLVVVVATDKNVVKVKGRLPMNSQQQRKEVVGALRFVDQAFVGFEDDMIKSVERVKPDVVALGYDQRPSDWELREKLSKRGIKAKIVRLEPYLPEEYKTTKIRARARQA